LGSADRSTRSFADIHPGRRQGTSRHLELELLPVSLREEAYLPLGRTMFQRIRIAGRVLPGNLRKIHSQDLPSFLYATKRCSSRSDHRLCLHVLERLCSSSLEHPSSPLLRSGSLSLKSLSSLLLDGLLPSKFRCKNLDIYGLASPRPRTCRIDIVTTCLHGSRQSRSTERGIR